MRISDWSSDVCSSDLRFFFAVPQSFPQALIPPQQGLMVADGYGATVIRESGDLALNGARRRALQLKFAQLAALRLQAFSDPPGAGGRLESQREKPQRRARRPMVAGGEGTRARSSSTTRPPTPRPSGWPTRWQRTE